MGRMTSDQVNCGQGPAHRLRLLVPTTVFLGSFLLFWVQPMLGRALLPRFGGSAAVWAVCLAAYQTLLLAGYAYAYLLCRLPARARGGWHLGILLATGIWMLGLLALQPTAVAWPHVTGWPTLDVLLCVLFSVGLPYGLLAAGSTLVQRWVADDPGARNVYHLYAVSNLGSLLGLLAYPLVLEPFTALHAQWRIWTVLFVAYTLLLGWMLRLRTHCIDVSPPSAATQPPQDTPHHEPVGLPERLNRPWLWAALPAVSSFLLVAVTNHLSTDVTPIPLLWAVLLAAFLLSYVVGFSRAGEKGLSLWLVLAIAVLTTKALLRSEGGQRGFLPALLIGVALVFLAPLFLHAWLFAIRPAARHLAGFYLAVAAGGALGGALASLAAPLLFTTIAEYPLALVLVAVLGAWFTHTRNDRELRGINETILLCCLAVPLVLGWRAWHGSREVVHRARNFYGALKVTESALRSPTGQQGVVRRLTHGGTLHGAQALLPARASRATTYYGPLGGGLALRWHPAYSNAAAPMRVGCIGLGIGTMAAYGRTNDTYRFYEINPDVVAVASNTNLFTYIADCPAHIEIRLGDARQTLERERAEGEALLDVLVVDAYSGDAVPIHLATREAFDLYASRLAPGGILAMHISNWHIDLLPLCKAAGQFLEMTRRGVLSTGNRGSLVSSASWVFLSHTTLDQPLPAAGAKDIDWQAVRDLPLPTDSRGSLLEVVRFGMRPPTLDAAFDWDAIDQLFR